MERKLRLLSLFANKYVLDILGKLSSAESRFSDLADACPSERLRSIRLAELEDFGLIERKARKAGKKFIIIYEVTKKGRELTKKIEQIIKPN